MNPLDENDEGEVSFDEPSQAERDLAPKAPSVTNYEDRFPEPDESELIGDISEVDDRTFSAFIACVVYTNVALFAVSLGAMLWYFRGLTTWGGGLVVVGLLAAVRTYQQYRAWEQYREKRDAGELDDGDDGGVAGEGTDDGTDGDDGVDTDDGGADGTDDDDGEVAGEGTDDGIDGDNTDDKPGDPPQR